jgi:hypothetical protein
MELCTRFRGRKERERNYNYFIFIPAVVHRIFHTQQELPGSNRKFIYTNPTRDDENGRRRDNREKIAITLMEFYIKV